MKKIYYLCIIKLKLRMKTLLEKYGFINTDNINEYKKNQWIVRLEDNRVEIFENPSGKYFIGELDNEIFESFLKDVI